MQTTPFILHVSESVHPRAVPRCFVETSDLTLLR